MMQSIFGMPEAHAQVYGNDKNRKIRGDVYFYGVHDGTLVVAEIYGLPNIMKISRSFFLSSEQCFLMRKTPKN